MFSRLLILVASLNLFLGALSSAPHLRAAQLETIADVIPVDHHRARQAASVLLKSNKKLFLKDNKILHEALTKFNEIASKKSAEFMKSAHKMNVESSASQREVTWGSFAIRHRPNSDCSGRFTSASSHHIGICNLDGSGSNVASCFQEDGDETVQLIYHSFSNQDCSGTPDFTYTDDVLSGLKCRFEYDDIEDNLKSPSMMGVQCTGRDFNDITNKGGIANYIYSSDDSNCEEESIGVHIQRFGACQLYFELYDDDGNIDQDGSFNDYTLFYYINFDTCDPTQGTMDLTAFKDSACTKPVWQGTLALDDENGDYDTCYPTDSTYERLICVLPNEE